MKSNNQFCILCDGQCLLVKEHRRLQLVLPVKKQYFDEIKSSIKPFEYRLRNEYWKRRIFERYYDDLVITLGYPKTEDTEKRIIMPYAGYLETTITHPHFGNEPVEVFAIRIERYDLKKHSGDLCQ